MFTNPTITDFKGYFTRDFDYGTDPENNILDADLTKALNQTVMNINVGIFPTQQPYTYGFLLMMAHFLSENMLASSQGISGKYDFLLNNKSVGSVSVGITIPDQFLRNPIYAMYMRTNYGAQFIQFVFPLLQGTMFSVRGAVHP